MMRGLAWDDEPEFMDDIAKLLTPYGIELVVENQFDCFAHKLVTEKWNFVITDFLDERPAAKDALATGLTIAKESAKHVPAVFVVTSYLKRVDLDGMEFPDSVVFKSKRMPKPWIARDIVDHLKERSLFVQGHEVFLVYGHDKHVTGFTKMLESRLSDYGLKPIKGDKVTLGGEATAKRLADLMKTCGTVVAVCTPDDEIGGGKWAPRDNVLFEMGIAAGLRFGLDRLVILQLWGSSPDQQAVLPTDFGGITIRFTGPVNPGSQVFQDLDGRLKYLGVIH